MDERRCPVGSRSHTTRPCESVILVLPAGTGGLQGGSDVVSHSPNAGAHKAVGWRTLSGHLIKPSPLPQPVKEISSPSSP
jgi:hypothetical protein